MPLRLDLAFEDSLNARDHVWIVGGRRLVPLRRHAANQLPALASEMLQDLLKSPDAPAKPGSAAPPDDCLILRHAGRARKPRLMILVVL
jgi:hypothetical protein